MFHAGERETHITNNTYAGEHTYHEKTVTAPPYPTNNQAHK